MKTCPEVAEWCDGAARAYGDPSVPVCQLFFRWQSDLKRISGQDLVCGIHNGDVILGLGPAFPPLPLRVATGEPTFNEHDELTAFGAEVIAPGVWALTPSLNAEGLIHGFVVLYGVPDPAPWEQRILLL